MNGRMYDAKLGRFLSPDNFVQDPYNTQNFNRYGYVLNNPLMYSDPSGEFIHLIIGAVYSGVINWAINGAEFTWKGLGHFAVGAVAGALSAGIGAGVSSAIARGSFSAGFMGTQAAMTAASSFVTGAAVGASAGFSAGFITGLGNGLLNGQNFGQAIGSGFRDGIIGGLSGGVIGGLASGIHAAIDERRFWDGATVWDTTIVDQANPYISQKPKNCVAACGESATNGRVTQAQIRNGIPPGQNGGLGDGNMVQYLESMGEGRAMPLNKVNGEVLTPTKVINRMDGGTKIFANLSGGEGIPRHEVLLNRVDSRLIFKPNGTVIRKFRYWKIPK